MANVDLATLTAKLTLDAKSFTSGIDTATKKVDGINKGNAWSKIGESAKSIAKGFEIVGGAITTTAGIAVSKAMDFESAFTGVRKTINTTGMEKDEIEAYFSTIRDGIIDMSTRLPASATEIAGVAEAAGQLGIEKENILSFTEVMIGLGSATNVSATEAAVALAQFANVAGMAPTDFDKLGSSIVALGNNMATDERTIITFATELANLKKQAGMSEADIMGLSATLASLGLDAAASGTAMQRLAMDITDSVAKGGDKLQVFAETSGMTADEFARMWETDATSAFQAFITGLGSKESYEQLEIFDSLDIKQMREIDMLQRLAGNSGLLADAIYMSNEAWRDNNALQEEVNTRNEDTTSKFEMLKNQVMALGIEIGTALLPIVQSLFEQAKPLLDRLTQYIKEHPDTVERIVKVGAALLGIGATISTITNVVTSISGFINIVKTLGSAISILTGGGAAAGAAGGAGIIGGLGTALTALLPVIAAVGAVVGTFAIGWKNNWFGCRDTFNEVYEQTGSKMEAFRAVIRSIGQQIADGLKNFFENKVKPFFSNLWSHISEWFSTAWGNIKQWFGELWAHISDWFSNLVSNVKEWFSDIWSHLTEWLSNAWSNVSEWFSNLWNNLTDWLSNIWNSLTDWLSNIWSRVTEWFGNLVSGIKEWFANIKTTVSENVTEAWNKVNEIITTAWNWVKDTFEAIVTNVKTWIGNVKTSVTEGVTELWNTVKEKVSAGITEVKNKLTEFGNTVKNWLSEKLTNVKTFFSDLKTNASEKFSEIKTTITEKVSTMWLSVKDKLASFKTGWRETFEALKSYTSEKMEAIKSKVTDATNKIGDALNKVGSWLESAWDKISSWASNAWDKITSIFNATDGSGGYDGYMASGGYAQAGGAYIVGKAGPELFVPNTSGYVYSHEDTMGMLGGEINIYIQGDVYDDQQSMEQKLKGAMLDVLQEQMAYG